MYNGHKNWNHWNVSLWISNDEGLYRVAMDCLEHEKTLKDATESMLSLLWDTWVQQCAETNCIPRANHPAGANRPCTPDGAPYTFSSVKAAIRGLKD